MSPAQHEPGMCPVSSTLTSADNNTFWNSRLGQGTAARGLFGSIGVHPMNLSQVTAQTICRCVWCVDIL